MVVNVEVPPFVDVRVIGDLLGAPAICFQLDLVLREIEEGEVGFGLPPPVQGILPGWVTFWRRIHGAPFVVGVVAWRSQWSGITTGRAYHNSSRASSSTM